MRSFALLAVVTSMMVACSSPAEDGAEESTSEAALAASGSPSLSATLYRGDLYTAEESYTVEVELKHPTLVRTTETVRGSQIMSDSPWCDAFIEGVRAEMVVRVTSMTTGDVVAQNSDQTWINASKLLDDSVCPQGIITRDNRHAVANLEAESDVKGVSVPGRDLHIPFGYVGAGFVSIPVQVSFEATRRGTFQSHSESDRGSSTFVVPGRARIEPSRSAVIQAGNFGSTQPIVLMRVD